MTSLVPLEETTSEPFEQSKTSSIEQTHDHKKTPQAQSPDSPHQIASSWSDYSESDYSERFYDLQTDPFDEVSTTLTSSFLAKQSVAQNGKKLSSTKTDLSSGQHFAGVERQKATSSLYHGELTKRPPIFEGRRVYVKPIRSWKEPLDDDDSQRQLKNEKDSWYDSDLSRKRTKVNMKNEYERTSSLRNRWDNIYRTVPDEHVFAKTEVLPSEYGGRLHSTGDDSKRRNGIRDDSIFLDVHNNRTVIESGSSGDGVKFLPDDHNAIMLFIYATLVLVALLTMAGFLVTLAMRRYLV
ncbi:unnamed protein product [Anisakis simplex]|uniref:LEM domain-containing protein n=1 Tax=Anisakis simplex TaxID=6269 RepID=A0A0M3JU97_ANISI|nr:unnamed protein product [Anisakis simplex]